jgi:hypothetical protein
MQDVGVGRAVLVRRLAGVWVEILGREWVVEMVL